MHAQSRKDWASFEPDAIPSKTESAQLERWLEQFGDAQGLRSLDLGCGNGAIARRLVARGFTLVGVDINKTALAKLSAELPQAKFYERDVAAADGFGLGEAAFDAVVCQLVMSIVGDAHDRHQLLLNARAVLRQGGRLFASFSGLSDDLNPAYGELYARDYAAIRETGSYFSRDAAGHVLYRTHHFSRAEILALLEQSGFGAIDIDEQIESSSRRPDQRARFYYACCERS
jgi:SAM-dependent methyltransferase